MEIGVHTGDDDPGVDGEQFDADGRHPYVGVDDEALVEDQIEYIGQTAGAGSPRDGTAAGRHGHRLDSFLVPLAFFAPLAPRAAAPDDRVAPFEVLVEPFEVLVEPFEVRAVRLEDRAAPVLLGGRPARLAAGFRGRDAARLRPEPPDPICPLHPPVSSPRSSRKCLNILRSRRTRRR